MPEGSPEYSSKEHPGERKLESPLAQKKDSQITVRLPSALRDALAYFSESTGERKRIGGLVEEILIKGIADLARQNKVVLIELRLAKEGETLLKRLIPLKQATGPTSKEEKVVWERLKEEGIEPSSLPPGLYVLKTELDNRLLESFLNFKPHE